MIIKIVNILLLGLLAIYNGLSEPFRCRLVAKFKHLNIWITIILLIGVLFNIYISVVDEIQNEEKKLYVTPDVRKIGAEREEVFLVKLVNNTDTPFYQIDIHLNVVDGPLSVDDISIEPVQGLKVSSGGNGFSMGHDLFGITFIDENKNKIRSLIINDINAHSTLEYVFRVDGMKYKKPSNINIKMVKTSDVSSEKISFNMKVDKDNHFEVGKMLSRNMEYLKSIEEFSKEIKINPDNFKAYTNRATSYLLLGNIEMFLMDCTKSIELNNSGLIAYQNLINYYYEVEQFDLLKKILDNMLSSNPDSVGAHLFIANLYRERFADYDNAVNHYSRVLSLDSDNLFASMGIAIALEKSGKYSKSLEYYSKVLSYLSSRRGPMYVKAKLSINRLLAKQ